MLGQSFNLSFTHFVMKYFSLFLSLLGLSFSVLTVSAAEPTACTMEYAPVCGSVQVQCFAAPCYPVRETFSNSCMASARGATNVTPWACESAPVKMSPRVALQNGIWWVSTLNGKPISASGSLTFSRNTFSAKLCNTLSGQYGTLRGDILIARRVISTKMYCESDIMTVENAMSHLTLSRFMVGDTTLTITTRKGDVIVWKKR